MYGLEAPSCCFKRSILQSGVQLSFHAFCFGRFGTKSPPCLVVVVAAWACVAHLSMSIHPSLRKKTWPAYEQFWCMACSSSAGKEHSFESDEWNVEFPLLQSHFYWPTFGKFSVIVDVVVLLKKKMNALLGFGYRQVLGSCTSAFFNDTLMKIAAFQRQVLASACDGSVQLCIDRWW